jgi:hypothetical protein
MERIPTLGAGSLWCDLWALSLYKEVIMNYIPYISTLVTAAFTAAVYRRYQRRGGTHLLLWSLGLLFYGLGTLSEVILGLGFSAPILKLWYLTGAMLTAAWLGQGTVHLLVRKRGVAQGLSWVLAIISLVAIVLIIMAPITGTAASFDPQQPVSGQYKNLLERSGGIIALTILLNLYGTLTLVGGALYSAYLFWRKQVLANRMYGNILIAAGALMPAMGGSFLKAGFPDWLYLSELLGAILMYTGFVLATQSSQNAADK